MFTKLKQDIQQQELGNIITEAMTRNTGSDVVKSVFLDGFQADVLGAESDPQIRTLVDTIPEYQDQDSALEAEIHSLTENLIETDI